MTDFNLIEELGHEQIVFCSNKEANLKAIIAIHDTTLGPAIGGTRMWNYVSVEEALEKLRLGLYIFIREATNAQNLRPLLPLITAENNRRICWCTDDRQPADLLDDGSIDHMIRIAIAEGGIDPAVPHADKGEFLHTLVNQLDVQGIDAHEIIPHDRSQTAALQPHGCHSRIPFNTLVCA